MALEVVDRLAWNGANINEAFDFLGVEGHDIKYAKGVGIVMDQLIIDRKYGLPISVKPGDEVVRYENGAMLVLTTTYNDLEKGNI